MARITTAMGAVAITVALAACSSSHSSYEEKASAAATSTQVQAAKQAVASDVKACQPKGVSVTTWEAQLLSKKARTALYTCIGLTPSNEGNLKTCVIAGSKAAIVSTQPKAAREASFFTQLGKCLK